MALFIGDFATPQSKQILVPGVPGKIILVVRLGITTASGGSFMLLSDPNGASEADLTPKLYTYAYGCVELALGRRYGLPAGRGKAVAFTSVLSGSPQDHGIMLWYEVVN
jgi:hypothetical protein